MAKPIRQSNGKWKITIYAYTDKDGRKHSKTFTCKTKAECIAKANEYELHKGKESDDMTIKEACFAYIELYEDVLSVSTVRGYDSIARSIDSIADIRLGDITEKRLQKWVSEMIKEGLSRKTIKNKTAFVVKAIKTQDKTLSFDLMLPRAEKKRFHTPEDKDITKLLEYARTTDSALYNAILLGAFGPLRRSEMLALTRSDIHGNTITINKSLQLDKNGNYVIGDTKTIESTRDIKMPDFVIKSLVLGDSFRVVDLSAPALYHRLKKACAACDLEDIHLHSLRHYSATIMHYLGLVDRFAQGRGGWSTDRVMKEIYVGDNLTETERQEKILFDHFEKVANIK